MSGELSRCSHCLRLAFQCDCPTYDPYQEDTVSDDAINPSHYKGERWECIEIIEAHGLDHFRATALAYILRAARKNGEEDLHKALWYLYRLANSPMNLANANGFAATDPARAIEMTGNAVADDFRIYGQYVGAPSCLRSAIKSLVPNAEEFVSAAALLEDVNDTIAAIESHLQKLSADKS